MFTIKNRIIFLSIIIIISNLSFISNKNFVTNPSFETPGGMVNAEGWSADNWGCWATNTTAHTGKRSMHGSKPGDNFWQIRNDFFYGIKYRFTLWIKVKDVYKARLKCVVESSDYKSGIYVYHDSIAACKGGTCIDQWYKLSSDSEMNFKPASHYVISISMEGEGANPTGEFWVDDITVEPIEYNILIGIEVRIKLMLLLD